MDAGAAAPRHRLRDPARRALPAPHGRRQHRDRAAAARAGTRRKARARSLELLERVGLPAEFAGRYPHQLSGGQQQRVGVARALAADPPVMLMDEPFSAVDPVVREQLQDEFLRLQSELGKTILFVTHDIDEAVKLGDQVAVLRVGGELAQLADPATLLGDPHDDFVADFVGPRPRLPRPRASAPRPSLQPDEEPTVALGAAAEEVRRAGGDWLLVVDDDRRPLGWVEPAAVHGPVERDRTCTAAAPSPGSTGSHAGRARRGAVVAERPRRRGRRATVGCSARSPRPTWSPPSTRPRRLRGPS